MHSTLEECLGCQSSVSVCRERETRAPEDVAAELSDDDLEKGPLGSLFRSLKARSLPLWFCMVRIKRARRAVWLLHLQWVGFTESAHKVFYERTSSAVDFLSALGETQGLLVISDVFAKPYRESVH